MLSVEVPEPIGFPAGTVKADVARANRFVERLANDFVANPAFSAGCVAGKVILLREPFDECAVIEGIDVFLSADGEPLVEPGFLIRMFKMRDARRGQPQDGTDVVGEVIQVSHGLCPQVI